jgi:hypothetical protein
MISSGIKYVYIAYTAFFVLLTLLFVISIRMFLTNKKKND